MLANKQVPPEPSPRVWRMGMAQRAANGCLQLKTSQLCTQKPGGKQLMTEIGTGGQWGHLFGDHDADCIVFSFSPQPRAEIITTFALCGFANLSSVGIMLGGLSELAATVQ